MKKLCMILSVLLVALTVGCGKADDNNNNNNQNTGTTQENTGKTDNNTGTTDNTQNNTGTTDNQNNTGTTDNAGGATDATYKDGTYDGAGDKWQFGQENATVTVSGGKITNIVLRRLTTDGKEVNYDEWTGQTRNNQTYPNLKQFREDMAKKMIEAQSEKVDTITGATVSTENWKVAVQRALEKAK